MIINQSKSNLKNKIKRTQTFSIYSNKKKVWNSKLRFNIKPKTRIIIIMILLKIKNLVMKVIEKSIKN
jgi:hypothetical protein